MKVVFECTLWQSRQIDDFVVIETGDTQTGTANKIKSKFRDKYVRITIEEIKEPVKESPKVCYAAMGVT